MGGPRGGIKAAAVHNRAFIAENSRAAAEFYAFFFTSLTLEKTMPSARSLV